MKLVIPILTLLTFLAFAGCGPSDGIDAAQKARIEELSKLPRHSFKKGGVAFSVANLPELRRVWPDSVAWAGSMPQTEDNGPIVYYFVRGYDQQLSSPQVRIEYINKALPDCGSEQELFTWLKGVFVNDVRQGTVINEGQTLATADGQVVGLLEIRQPTSVVNDSLSRSGKSMAFAYLDQGDRFVGVNYTALEDQVYEEGLPLFKDIILSYRKE